MSEREDGCFVPPVPNPRTKLTRKSPEEKSFPYQTRLRKYHYEALQAILDAERQRNPKLTEARVLRGLLRLGVVRYRELGRIPEVD